MEALALLKSQHAGEVHHFADHPPTPELLERAQGLLIRSGTRVDGPFLDQCPALRVIVTATSGYDHLDLDVARQRGVTLMHAPNSNAVSAAEQTFALILAAQRRLIEAHTQIQKGTWNRSSLVGSELARKTLAIIGLGRVGRHVAHIASAFQMKCISYDPYVTDDVFAEAGATRVGLDELIRCADIITLHVPYTAETDNFLHGGYLCHAQPHCLLINTSRGKILRERELLDAINKGWIGAAALDVFDKEPLATDSPLLGHPKIICTPHIGATTQEALRRSGLEAAQKLMLFLKKGEVQDALPPPTLWAKSLFMKPPP